MKHVVDKRRARRVKNGGWEKGRCLGEDRRNQAAPYGGRHCVERE